MSDVITASAAARAALAVAEGAPAIVVAVAIEPGGAARRMILDSTAGVRGSLGHAALDDAALHHAQHALEQAAAEPAVETVTFGDRTWLLYVEAHHPPERLIIVGAGHIAVPLAHLGRLLDFRVLVLDDREEFATADRFDAEVVVRQADFETDPFRDVAIDERSYVALVTRGHKWDFDCLRRLVGSGVRPRYIGMIGSRRRVRAAFHALLEAGTPRAVLVGIHAPIGLGIGAETPAEIAVAIAAELVAVRRGMVADSLTAREQVLERLLKEP